MAALKGLVGFFLLVGMIGATIDTVKTGTVKRPPTATTAESAKPDYCNGAAAERLPECGWTPERDQQMRAREASRKADEEAFIRYLAQQAHDQCDKPIAKMSVSDIEDCGRSGNRWLREQQ